MGLASDGLSLVIFRQPTVVTVNGLLRNIRRCDRCRHQGYMLNLTSTGSGDLVFGSLDFGRASLNLEVVGLFIRWRV